jgi:hypothetical protein
MTKASATPKRTAARKIAGDDGPIKPHDPSNVLQNPTPPTPLVPDPQATPPAVVRPVVKPPEPGPAQPPPSLVP